LHDLSLCPFLCLASATLGSNATSVCSLIKASNPINGAAGLNIEPSKDPEREELPRLEHRKWTAFALATLRVL
jgi:hypothetical protein